MSYQKIISNNVDITNFMERYHPKLTSGDKLRMAETKERMQVA